MHSLSKVHIKNFRSCKDVMLPLDYFAPLVVRIMRKNL